MKLSESWLREWVNPPLDATALAAQLTMAGLEVDEIVTAAPDFTGVIVAKIIDIKPHPNADRLRVCTVDVGQGAILNVVCGAANARAGLVVALAQPGAELPWGVKITQAAVRGVESNGMLCSAKELGLADSSEGLLELPADLPLGNDFRQALKLDDRLLVMELTPNRGDCLSVRGLAREIAALNRLALRNVEIKSVAAQSARTLTVQIDDAAACPRYIGRIVSGINPQAVTPMWMRERLRRCGFRSIHPVVDITNYVLLELGQPMHAFDLAELKGAVHVRRARKGESLALLDGQVVELDPSTLLIADAAGPLAMAGVMGGLYSAVTEKTTDIFFESACFAPKAVAGQGRRYKLHTDSLHRFERGVDPELQRLAIERATQLLLDIAGGVPGPLSEVVGAEKTAAPVRLRHARLAKLLGAAVAPDEVSRILRDLGMQIEARGDEWQVTPPSYRYDIAIEADLIEEVARIYGYARLPLNPKAVSLPAIAETETRVAESRLRDVFVNRGYQEAVTYSFVDPVLQARLEPQQAAIDLDNPIAAQLAQMRTTLWSGLLPAWAYNVQRQQARVRFFELGMRFVRDVSAPNGIRQEPMLAGLVSGPARPEQWALPARAVDFYDLKGDVEAVLRLGGSFSRFSFEAAVHPALHPAQAAQVSWDGQPIGWLGRLHPGLAGIIDVKEALPLVFELQLAPLRQAHIPFSKAPSEFPFVRRDLALLVPESVSGSELRRCVQEAGEAALQDVLIFDVYRGRGLQSGFKSVALGLIFQDYSRTLTDIDVAQSIARLQSRLEKALGASIRG